MISSGLSGTRLLERMRDLASADEAARYYPEAAAPGGRACPPEDADRVWGHQDLLEAIGEAAEL
jgi:hypothetical protein